MARYHVTAFYCFASLSEDEVARVETALSDLAEAEKDLGGLVILAPEGINGTIAGSEGTVSKLKEVVRSFEPFHEILFKDSFCRLAPFPRFKTKRREEIVTLHRTDLVPTERSNNHLSPEEWNEMMAQDDVVVIDTRNAYETRLGMFEGAVDPNIDTFSEFGEFVQQSGWQRDQKVLMYCTGGIRCEKAILEMQQLGFENVYQLEEESCGTLRNSLTENSMVSALSLTIVWPWIDRLKPLSVFVCVPTVETLETKGLPAFAVQGESLFVKVVVRERNAIRAQRIVAIIFCGSRVSRSPLPHRVSDLQSQLGRYCAANRDSCGFGF